MNSMLQVGEFDVDDALDDAILGRDPGLCVDGAAVVCEQVVDTPDDCWEVWIRVDDFVCWVTEVGENDTLRLEIFGNCVDDGWCGVGSGVVGEW